MYVSFRPWEVVYLVSGSDARWATARPVGTVCFILIGCLQEMTSNNSLSQNRRITSAMMFRIGELIGYEAN